MSNQSTEASRQEAWQQVIRRLDASYSVGGREALAHMNAVEVYVLHCERMMELQTATEHFGKFPHDELGQLRREKAEREVTDIGEFIRERERTRDLEIER